MVKTLKVLIEVLFCCKLIFLFSCSQRHEQYPAIEKISNTITPPQVTLFANLPDSNKPVTVSIEKLQKPKGKSSYQQPAIHSFIDSTTGLPIPPEAQGIGFFTTFTTDQGLALDGVYSSLMDKKGNLWFGTNGRGISRYDGKAFTTFNAAQGLANNNVLSILEDKTGNLWFCTLGGVSRYDGISFTNYTVAQGLTNNYVTSAAEDKMGNLWFGTFGGGISRFDGKRFINYTIVQGLAHNDVFCIREDKNGNLWFGTFGGGATRYDGKNFTNYTTAQGLSNNYILDIEEDKTGDLWFGTNGGLCRYDGKDFTTYNVSQGLANNAVRSIANDRMGNLWFGTMGGGVSRYDGKSFVNYTTVHGLSNNYVLNIIEDKLGNLWFGTSGGGVCRYEGMGFTSYTTAQGLAHNLVFGMEEDKSGNLWFTTAGGVSCYNGRSFTNYTTAQGLVSNSANSIREDKKGDLWIGTSDGVSRYDGKMFINYTTAQGLVNNSVWSVTEDKAGNLWFGTNGGASRFDGKSFTNYTSAQGLPNNYVFCIKEDRAGNLWLGTNGGGVSRYDGKSFTNYTIAQGLGDNMVLCVTEDKNGNLWFGTGNGVSRYDGNTFTNYSTADGLPDNNVLAILTDSASNIIFGTALGAAMLVSFAPNSAGDKANHIHAENELSNDALKNYHPQFEVYNTSTGYPVKDLNQMAMFKDRKGIIWIGTGADKTGLVRFDYNAIHKSSGAPFVVIQNIKINNKNICWHDLVQNQTFALHVSDSNMVAPNIVEEIATMDKKLSAPERESMRSEFGEIKFDSIASFYPIPAKLVLPYIHNSITFDFAAIEPARPNLIKYQYILQGYDKEWSPPGNKTTATYGNIFEGTYQFKLTAQRPSGVWSEPIIYTFSVLPPWWRTWWAYALYIVFFLGTLGSFIRWRIRELKKEKLLLEEKVVIRTHELKKEKEKVEGTLTELKATQAQLIQSEKMASLGELTAGIAHEIQNPLNFINNFSEINTELIEELIQEVGNGNIEEITFITGNLKDNEQKINHHGKRADAIVKGMLQHSLASTGKRELSDINALASEYLRLSYHGIRAKDKSFNAAMQKDLDEQLGKINIVPQDIGRALLNLFNNAFYAVSEKEKKSGAQYEPTVFLTTKKQDDKVVIIVKDNGMGMPQNIVTKIFQPFFTTKPTGQGTGLGLSLTYDIVTKGHGGQLKVETKEGEGTAFIIILPGIYG